MIDLEPFDVWILLDKLMILWYLSETILLDNLTWFRLSDKYLDLQNVEYVQKSQFTQNKKEWKQHLPNLDIIIDVYS